ncbi:MAG: gliding motility-associated C-terminal domain-containing protein, partial [Saprospiraceae bacterium]
LVISPAIYVDEAAESRFDHAWRAYDFDLIPTTNTFVDGKLLDTHPTLPGQAPSRDVFYCTTGATVIDPNETQCDAQFNDLIYAQPPGVPKPLFLQNDPPPPAVQPWRNLWYTFKLSGSGICTLRTAVLMGPIYKPLIAVYESAEDGTIPWSMLQTTLMDPANVVIPGLKLIKSHVSPGCDSYNFDLVFTKSGCVRDQVRYYVLASFDTQFTNIPPNLPNQAISLSLKYDPRPTFNVDYDERNTANVINGLLETTPPYTTVKLTPGDSFTGVDFSLLCYTKNVTDPPGCDTMKTGKSAWFRFEASATGHFYGALQEIGIANGWFANVEDMTLYTETSPGGPLVQIAMDSINTGGHEWVDGCIDRGVYYLLVRHCLRIDTIQPYRVVIKLEDSPGDFCSNAIQINVVNNNPVIGSTLIDCHTIGTDVGEFLPDGNSCFFVPGRKTTWFHAVVNAGPMVDLNFELGENFQGGAINLSDLSYRILSGSCGAMTPIVCSASGTNVITLNCLAPGEYYVQVSMPERTGPSNNSPELKGLLMLTITATPSDPMICSTPFDPNQVLADFALNTGCDSVSFQNLSTSGTDITYLWEFPNGTSTDANPVWTPPGPGTYSITLTVTNVISNSSAIKTLTVDIINPFANYVPIADDILCNHMGNVLLDATVAGATYEWNDGSTLATRIVVVPGTYKVIIRKDGCEKRDTVVVTAIDAIRTISSKICPEDKLVVHGQVFDKSNPSGVVTVPNADPSGCDSLLNVNLQFYPAANTLLTESICFGDSYTFANQNLTQSGTYTNMLSGINGCDSLVTLDLTVKSLVIADNVVTSCAGASVTLQAGDIGASYLWNNGATTDSIIVNVDGTYVVSISDIDNCVIEESVFDVTFGQLAVPAYVLPSFLCPGSDILLTATGSSGSYQWFDDAAGQNILATGSTFLYSNVTHDDTLYVMAFDPSIDHCESNLVPIVLALEDEPAHSIQDEIICAGSTLILPWGESVTPTTDDSYAYAWQNSVSGCDSLDLTVNVALIHLPPVDLPSSFTLQYGDSVLLVPQIDFIVDSLRWTPAAGLSCTDCVEPWASPEESIDYTLTIWSADGCVTTAVISIKITRDVNIYIPNVFTPDGDGINDIFTAFGNREVKQIRRLQIYDRWGNGVWQGENFPADGSFGWDGLFKGKKMQPGVMAWVCVVELANGEIRTFAGDVTLVR